MHNGRQWIRDGVSTKCWTSISTLGITSEPSGKQSSNFVNKAWLIVLHYVVLKSLGFLCFTTLLTIVFLFSVLVFSFFTFFGFFYVIKLSTFITNVDYGCTIFPFFTFSFSLLCTIVNYTQMFSPFNTPMLEMLTLALMLGGKFNLSLNFSSLQSNPTWPQGSLFGSLKNKNTRDSSSSNWRISYTRTFLT
jgi:hypothetical protein